MKILLCSLGTRGDVEPFLAIAELLKHKIPAIINGTSGGFSKPEHYPGHVLFTDHIPYERILANIYAVIHHGGSGTTHLAIKYGCACMIVPHILDQQLWNDIVSRLGVGPKGIPIKKFNAKRFEVKLLDIIRNPDYKEKSEEIGRMMTQENYKDYLINLIENQ